MYLPPSSASSTKINWKSCRRQLRQKRELKCGFMTARYKVQVSELFKNPLRESIKKMAEHFMNRTFNKKYFFLLIFVAVVAFGAYYITNGSLDFSMLMKREKSPSDKKDNMYYGVEFECVSQNVVDRNGIVLKNFGDKIRAVELSSDIELKVSDISARSKLPIQRFSEYVGYLYMFDGQTVYRSGIDGKNLHATVEGCSKFEPMGDYLYSLKDYKGTNRLFRCSLVGTYEKMLFTDPVKDFWTYDGNLLMLMQEGRYRFYSVVTKESLDHILPDGAHDISIDSEGILFLRENANRTTLYKRSYDSQTDRLLLEQNVLRYFVGPRRIALLYMDGDDYKAAVCLPDGSAFKTLEGMRFPAGCNLDLSADHLFVTDPEGTTWYSSIKTENWKLLNVGG
ncbi:MAG: hypothetical protein ACQGTM_04670 [bacterium]